MEGKAEQPALIEEVVQLRHPRPDVEERFGQQASLIVDDADLPLLLDQGQTTAAVRDRDHGKGMRQTPSHLLQLYFYVGAGGCRQSCHGGSHASILHQEAHAHFLPTLLQRWSYVGWQLEACPHREVA